MALGVVKSLARFLLLLNLCIYLTVAAISGWVLNNAVDHTYSTGRRRALPVGFFPLYFPMGNEATGFMIIFALIATVVGAASCLSGLHHLRVWNAQSLASSTASSMTAWALTLLAMGLGCKEIHIGGRNTKLITLESFLIIVSATKLFYILLIHAGFFGGNYCSYEDTYVTTTTTTAEPQKGRTPAASSV